MIMRRSNNNACGVPSSAPATNLDGENAESSGARSNTDRPSPFVIQVTAIASIGGILFGYDLGVISGALPQVTTAFDLTAPQQQSVVSILYVGGAAGAALGGSICDVFGRKRAIVITDMVFLVGAIILYLAPSYVFLLLGRVVVGFGVAVSGIADVAYLHEIAPLQWRGSIVSVNEACISLGFLLAFGVASLLSYEGNTSGWRLMFGLSGLLALVQLSGMRSLPESPSWLQERGRFQEAEYAWRRINSDLSFSQLIWAGDEMRELSDSSRGITSSSYNSIARDASATPIPAPEEEVSISRTSSPTLRPTAPGLMGAMPYLTQVWKLFKQFISFANTTIADYEKQTYIALFLAITQQLCGQTNVLSYAPLIFDSLNKDSGISSVRSGATLLIGVVKFLVTVIVIWRVEKTGRRMLLLVGMSTIALGLLLLTVAFGGVDVSDAQDGELTDKEDGLKFALPGVLLVVSGYSMSFGPLTWLLTSELFPTDIRGRALGASTIVTYASAALVTYTFLSAQEAFGASAVFGFYLLVTSVGVVFCFIAISETKGRSEAEIEEDLSRMMWWRRHSSIPLVQDQAEMTQTDSRDHVVV